ncbi:type II toxin-antitoxin system RelE/ParE family toxin [Cupriavidus necator]
MYEIRPYLTPDQLDIFDEWLRGLKDSTAKVSVVRRLNRAEQGNFGDHKFCRDGVWELRVDVGAGYRVYYGIAKRGRALTLTVLARIGKTGNGGPTNERPTPR